MSMNRAKAGMGLLISEKLAGQFSKWAAINERILLVEIAVEKNVKISIVTVYVPNEDDTSEEKANSRNN